MGHFLTPTERRSKPLSNVSNLIFAVGALGLNGVAVGLEKGIIVVVALGLVGVAVGSEREIIVGMEDLMATT